VAQRSARLQAQGAACPLDNSEVCARQTGSAASCCGFLPQSPALGSSPLFCSQQFCSSSTRKAALFENETTMGLYTKYVLPRLIDLAMRNKDTTRLRAESVSQAQGDVLEIGIGSGLNLPFYSSAVRHIYGVDPSIELQKIASKRASAARFPVTFFRQSAEERCPLPDASIDTIVMTWSLCSIPNPAAALQQMRPVLKQNGRLIFVEHGRSADATVKTWQDRITPFWKRIGGGCHLNRKSDDLIRAAGFQIIEQKNFYLPGPRPMTYTYQGVAGHCVTPS
jgi:ubiquinone/menaquinone biosynthesis C-methylase UbiE